MKTATSIEEQEERKNARDNGKDADFSPANTPPVRQKLKQRDAGRIAAWKWQSGQSGNPSGRPKHDLAAEIARAVFENNREALYKAYSKAALRGNAYAFKELADRGYGKLKERIEHDMNPLRDYSEEQLQERIAQLEKQLGYERTAPQILPPADPKPN